MRVVAVGDTVVIAGKRLVVTRRDDGVYILGDPDADALLLLEVQRAVNRAFKPSWRVRLARSLRLLSRIPARLIDPLAVAVLL